MYLGTCRPADWLGHVAKSAAVTKLDIAGLKPTAALADGRFLRVCSWSFLNRLYSFFGLAVFVRTCIIRAFLCPAFVVGSPRLVEVAERGALPESISTSR